MPKMFEHLKKWPRILVTGPQRSGTTIAAKMIAQDTGHWFMPEERIGVDSLNRLWHMLRTHHSIVVQAPAMSVFSNLLAASDAGLAVVMIRRDIEEILASQKRIGWRWEDPEYIRLLTLPSEPLSAAELKYAAWDNFQKECLGPQAYEVEYNSLEKHDLFIAKEGRAGFGSRQTQ